MMNSIEPENGIIDIQSHNLTILDGFNNSLNVENIDVDEEDLLRVKSELSEIKNEQVETEALYSCNTCGMSFNSIIEHIKQYHDGQEVILEMAEPQDDLLTAETPVNEQCDNKISELLNYPKNTLQDQDYTDNDGGIYPKKVVQIEKFWDRTPVSLSATKAPMIEKFFSNVEGVKVRGKSVTVAPTCMYRCNQCLEQFSKIGDFRTHACINGTNRCEFCDKNFVSLKALQLHLKVHESEAHNQQKVFLCITCGTEFSTHKSLRLHSRMHAPVRTRHVEAPEGTENTTFTCKECGKILSDSYHAAHMALHTSDAVTCIVCNRKFDSAESLAMHAAVHSEPIQIQTPTPSTSDIPTNSANLLNNLNTEATETSVTALEDIHCRKPYQCQHCGRRFTRPHEKVKHERIHTGEKPHVCEVCGKTFRVSYCLTLHMRTHTGVRPYACQHCGKRFKASSVYNHHLLTHGDVRAYTCPYCPKTFKTRVQLAGHKNSHTKPFRCTECSRPFASLYAARAHIQTHKKDNNLKFSCCICGASYGRAFALKDHMKQHNQEQALVPQPPRAEATIETENFLFSEEEIDGELIVP